MKSLHPVSATPPPEHTRVFWQHVRYLIETIWALFGGPETIAALHTLSRTDHKLLAAWLRKAEALVRRLLLAEAADVEIAENKHKPRKAARAKQIRSFNANEPHLWRVAFRLNEGDTYPFAGQKVRVPNRAIREARFADARPLAERFEALLRVFDAPERYVERAARLLRRAKRAIKALATVPLDPDDEGFYEPLKPLLCRAQARLKFNSS